jgi:iron complex transport system permease protein
MTRRKKIAVIVGLIILLVITILSSLAIGSVKIRINSIIRILLSTIFPDIPHTWPSSFETIVLHVRLPRILIGALVGSALATAGTNMQGLFKNPMADPSIIGISAGAGLGATMAIIFDLALLSIYFIPLMAFLGALVTVFIVYNLAKVGDTIPVGTMLLAGIAVGSFLSSVTSFAMYVGGTKLHQIMSWMLGGLAMGSWEYFMMACPIVVGGIILTFPFAKDLNIILLGEKEAKHLGVEVDRVKKALLILSSLITATAVAISGIIGFVGLMIPHIMRLIVGPDHRALLPSSALFGACFLICSDTVARTIIAPTEIPVGIITAFCGAPFFIYLLWKQKGRGMN